MPDTPKTPLRVLLLVACAVVAAVLLVLYVWRLPPFRTTVEMTENAYVRGSMTIIAPKVDGYVAEVAVQDFVAVKQGQVLVRLDDRNYQQKLEQARGSLAAQEANLANLAQTRLVREAGLGTAGAQIANARAQVINAKAQLERARSDLRRVDALIADDSLSQRERDQTVAALRQAEAALQHTEAAARIAISGQAVATQDLRSVAATRAALEGAVEAARAAVKLAEIDLENTQVRAPLDGPCRRGRRQARPVRHARHTVDGGGAGAGVGGGELQGGADGAHGRRAAGALLGRCAGRCGIPRLGRALVTGHRLGVQRDQARQRDRQLHEDPAATAGAHRRRWRSAAGGAAAAWHVGRRAGRHGRARCIGAAP